MQESKNARPWHLGLRTVMEIRNIKVQTSWVGLKSSLVMRPDTLLTRWLVAQFVENQEMWLGVQVSRWPGGQVVR